MLPCISLYYHVLIYTATSRQRSRTPYNHVQRILMDMYSTGIIRSFYSRLLLSVGTVGFMD